MTMELNHPELIPALLRATLAVTAAGLLAHTLLRVFRVESPGLHRLTWALVLLQGVFFFRVPVELAVLAPKLEFQAAAAMEAGPVFNLAAEGRGFEAPAAAAPAEPQPFMKRGHLLALIWAGGLGLVVLLHLLSYGGLIFSLRKARVAPARWQREWRRLGRKDGLKASAPLLFHAKLGPMLCLTPKGYRVVVPESTWRAFTPAQRLAVLEHEMAHIQRRDIWKSLAARLMALPHWYNPVAWWAVRQFEDAAEWACDQRLRQPGGSRIADYAQALLTMGEPRPFRLAASFANGAAISPRIRRLVRPGARDAWWKRGLFVLLAGGLALMSVVRVELVAQEMKHAEGVPSAEFEKAARDFAAKLQVSGELMERFHASLQTKPGVIMLKDRAAEASEDLREKAKEHALENFIAAYFDKTAGTYVVKADQKAWRDELLATWKNVQGDIDQMQPKLTEIAGKMAQDSEGEKLMYRVLTTPDASAMIYMEGIRERVRPGVEEVAEELDDVFVLNEKGNYEIPASRAKERKWMGTAGQSLLKVREGVEKEMKLLAAEVAEPDELHRRFKAFMTDPLFAMLMALHSVPMEMDHAVNVAAVIPEVVGEMEEVLEDRADGLRLREEERDEVEKNLAEAEGIRARAQKFASTLKAFAARIEPRDEVHQQWKDFLASDFGHVMFAYHSKMGKDAPDETFEFLLGQVLSEGDDKKLHLRAESEGEVVERMQELLRGQREIRRRGQPVDDFAGQVQDAEMSAVLKSLSGKLIVGEMIKNQLSRTEFAGLQHWIEVCFVAGPDGKLSPRPEAVEELERFLAGEKEIAGQLKTDF